MDSLKIRTKLNVLLIALLLVSLVINVMWTSYTQRVQAEKAMLEKSQILTEQMEAVWEFMDINQEKIDTDADGSYNFKGIYCVIAGKSISTLFTRNTDYLVRYVNETPRNKSSYPDEFETRALEHFKTGETEYFETTTYEGKEVFRYASAVFIKESCLDCHGEPQGEVDITGYPKEGKKLDDLGGMISIVMPTKLYQNSVQENIQQQIIYFFLIILILVLTVILAIDRLVSRPLTRLEDAAGQIEKGNLNIDLSEVHDKGEIGKLASQLGSMANELKDLYGNLEKQVDTRTKQLAIANARLEQQQKQLVRANELLQEESQYKSDFLAIMSHELRTPLTSILAYTDMWGKSAECKNDSEKETVREIKGNGQILLGMVNNILEMARLNEGKNEIELEEVDMVDLVGTVERTLGILAEKKNIEFTTKVNPDVPLMQSDWEKVRRIIENLISNAIKYTQKGGSVFLHISYDYDNDQVIIRVQDNGIGIKQENMDYIFGKFTQSDKSARRRYNGTGLGLAVVKELVDMLQGEVSVESSYQKGSTFTVALPLENKGKR